MAGGQLQLVAKGGQDSYLLGNPQITYFKIVYRRHTNFAKESVRQFFTTRPDYGRILNCTLSRDGDLVQDIYLEINLPELTEANKNYVYGIGNALIKKVELEIGGQIIDRHYSEWLNIWEELSCPSGHRVGLDEMVGNNPQNLTTGRLYVPLVFWFNKRPGLALPLAALHKHEVRLHFEIRENTELVYYDDGGSSYYVNAPSVSGDDFIKVFADYIYLDGEERQRFTQLPMEYLIEQVQFNGDEHYPGNTNSNFAGTKLSKTSLNFINPVKELIWVYTKDSQTEFNRFFNFSNGSANVFTTGKLVLDGIDFQTERNADYFLLEQNRQHHTNIPRFSESFNQRIYTYSFALKPEEHQPSGFCNFSRLNESSLVITYPYLTDDWTLKVYAVSYNIYRIVNGMGGLVFTK
jgi:hypothetical protein